MVAVAINRPRFQQDQIIAMLAEIEQKPIKAL
jgi:hypothetical protein